MQAIFHQILPLGFLKTSLENLNSLRGKTCVHLYLEKMVYPDDLTVKPMVSLMTAKSLYLAACHFRRKSETDRCT